MKKPDGVFGWGLHLFAGGEMENFSVVMRGARFLRYGIGVCLVLVSSSPTAALAKENILRGGVTLGQGYDSNIDRDYQDREAEWTSSVSPSLSISSSDKREEYFLRYAPEVVYSHRTDNERIDHSALGKFSKQWTERVRTFIQDSFRRAEEPYEDEEAFVRLSDKRGRNRYSVNSFISKAEYEYAQESILKLGYDNQVLDNSEAGREDFVKHSPGLAVTHRFDHRWSGVADYLFTHGNFDESDDLDRHGVNLYLYYNLTPSSKVFGRYGYSTLDYDGQQVDYDVQTATMGLERALTPTMLLALEGGGAFLSRDNGVDRDSFYFRFSLKEELQRGALAVSAESGIDEQQFSGVTDQGVSRYWKVKGNLLHNFSKHFQGTLTCSYRDDSFLERVTEEDEQEFRADAALSYTFLQWYKASVKYTYVNKDADVVANRYDDNRIFFFLSTEQDLLKW